MAKIDTYIKGEHLPGDLLMKLLTVIDLFLKRMRSITNGGLPKWYEVGKIFQICKLAIDIYKDVKRIFNDDETE